ncbi:hypothetical protein PP633_01685 [Mycobacteroides abscessus]|nr:hypothetical protein [Mycobacteroides abscessus]MDM2653135.1 hypothetical protein [Mycobacteroides abscessus]MDM2661958.1 hypothetical protein [Mycobacteroides abscessus]MDM2667066.1 hypothetical protein [Mycobacteroides abscessus]MDM2671465.1 hypothetical protein [Mycobacteroides abscessus]
MRDIYKHEMWNVEELRDASARLKNLEAQLRAADPSDAESAQLLFGEFSAVIAGLDLSNGLPSTRPLVDLFAANQSPDPLLSADVVRIFGDAFWEIAQSFDQTFSGIKRRIDRFNAGLPLY